MINIALLHDVMYAITADPDAYDQRYYGVATDCGTAYCVAGHAMIASGHRLNLGRSPLEVNASSCDVVDCGYCLAESENQPIIWPDTDGNPNIHVEARDLLGLTPTQANRLFDEDNTLPEVWAMVERYTRGRITRAGIEAQVVCDLAALTQAPPAATPVPA